MPAFPRRALIVLADTALFAWAASWLVIGGLALAGTLDATVLNAATWGTAVVAVTLASTVRVRARADAAGRALARLVLLFGAGVVSNMGPPWQLVDAAGLSPLLVAVASWGGGALAPVLDILYLWLPWHPHWLMVAAVLHFTAIYPRPLEFAGRARRALTRPALLWGVALGASATWAVIDAWAHPAMRQVAQWIATALIPAAAALTMANVRASYRAASREEEGRILGLLAAVLIALAGELLFHAWPLGRPPGIIYILHAAAPVAASLLAVYAVFVRGGLSPQLVVRRTALYGALSVGGIFAFALLDELLSSLLVAKLGVSDGFVSTIALAAVAVAFKPLHDRLSAWLNRRLARWAPAPDATTAEPATLPQPGLSA
jgi:hypothetical protein